MKISKVQTALIVIAISGIVGALVLLNFVKTHPIYAILIALGTVGVVVGAIMYKKDTTV
jgi:undecaprenyl pyrophosphate phosphatase UppP